MYSFRSAGLALVCALTLGSAANAATLTCPASFAGNNTTTYSLDNATACAYGNGTLNGNVNDTATITNYINAAGYPSPPSPTTGVYPIPATANFLEKVDTPGVGTYITVTGDNTGTIHFLANLTNVLIAIVDGQSTTPNWAVFVLGSVLAGTDLTYNVVRLSCAPPTSTNCNPVAQGTSHVMLFGNVSEVPLPPALVLFGSALVGMGILGRRRKNKVGLAQA
jgi:hypothetical protein